MRARASGGAWTTVSRMMCDLELTREEIYITIMDAKNKGLVEIIKTMEPSPYGLLSAQIPDLGRHTARAVDKFE